MVGKKFVENKRLAFSFTHLKIHAVSGDWEVSVPADGHDLEHPNVHVCQRKHEGRTHLLAENWPQKKFVENKRLNGQATFGVQIKYLFW